MNTDPAGPPTTAVRMPLAALPIGATGRVVAVEGADPVSRRLADLGFLPGTPILVLRRAPAGDPTIYRLRSYQLCLRKREANRILVEVAA